MSGVRPSILTGTRLGYPFLVTGKLDELAQLILRETLQCIPEVLYMLIRFHQAHLVHRVCLQIYQNVSIRTMQEL